MILVKYLYTVFFIFALLLFKSGKVNGETNNEISILAYDIPALLQPDKQGAYDKLIKQVIAIEQKAWRYTVAPPARVDQMFDSKLVDCIIPFDKKFHADKQTLNSVALGIAEAYIFTMDKKISDLSKLKGKIIGARNGMLYGPEFDALNLNVELVSRIEQKIEKLLTGRIDAFIAWAPDVDAVLKSKNIQLMRGSSFVVHHDAFLCHDTPKTRQFIVDFNRGLRKILP